MGQRWMNQDPKVNRSLLQMSLFGDGGVYASESVEEPIHFLAPARSKTDVSTVQEVRTVDSLQALTPVQGDLIDDLEAAIHGVEGEPIPRLKPLRSPDHSGPELNLNDETLLYFRKIGVRDLLAEMVLQSIRDCVYSQDAARMERLKAQNLEDFDELMCSADWLHTKEGQLAIQMLYPDWDHVTIVRRIYEDPAGVLARMSAAGMRRHQENLAGFDESSISDASGFSERLDSWGDADINGDDYSYR